MEVLECIKTRRSSRKFLSTEVEREKLDIVVEAGRFAPSGGNNQSAHLVVVKNETMLNELAELVKAEFSKMEICEGMYSSIKNSITQSKNGNYIFHYSAPVLIIVTNKKGYGNAMADSACVLENMMLMANELNLGSCWINQLHWLDENEAVRKYLAGMGITDEETICGALSVGYCENLNQIVMPRKGNPVTVIE